MTSVVGASMQELQTVGKSFFVPWMVHFMVLGDLLVGILPWIIKNICKERHAIWRVKGGSWHERLHLYIRKEKLKNIFMARTIDA